MRALDEGAAVRRFLAGRSDAEAPYLIPMGGTAALGDVGLVNAGFELAEQVKAGELPEPDELWVAVGTGGTAAGIALGIAAAGLGTRVVCVRVSSPRYGTWANLKRSFDQTRDFLRARDPGFPEVRLDSERAVVLHDFAGAGYGIPTEDGRRARALAQETAGLELDDTYTAKVFAALLALGAARREKRIVFWNSYDGRGHAAADADPERLPAELRGYVR
jgi:D-cysteine desulfhydrase